MSAYSEAMEEAVTGDLMVLYMVRDMNRKVALDAFCDHRIRQLPIIDARVDYKCDRCKGIIQGAI